MTSLSDLKTTVTSAIDDIESQMNALSAEADKVPSLVSLVTATQGDAAKVPALTAQVVALKMQALLLQAAIKPMVNEPVISDNIVVTRNQQITITDTITVTVATDFVDCEIVADPYGDDYAKSCLIFNGASGSRLLRCTVTGARVVFIDCDGVTTEQCSFSGQLVAAIELAGVKNSTFRDCDFVGCERFFLVTINSHGDVSGNQFVRNTYRSPISNGNSGEAFLVHGYPSAPTGAGFHSNISIGEIFIDPLYGAIQIWCANATGNRWYDTRIIGHGVIWFHSDDSFPDVLQTDNALYSPMLDGGYIRFDASARRNLVHQPTFRFPQPVGSANQKDVDPSLQPKACATSDDASNVLIDPLFVGIGKLAASVGFSDQVAA